MGGRHGNMEDTKDSLEFSWGSEVQEIQTVTLQRDIKPDFNEITY